MKKILIGCLICLMMNVNTFCYELSQKEQDNIDRLINLIMKKPKLYIQNNFLQLWNLRKELEEGSRKYAIIENILAGIIGKDGTIKIPENEETIRNNLISNLIISSSYTEADIDKLLFKNHEYIINNDNIFIFRTDKNISFNIMKYTTESILEKNNDIRIFVDQEGGQVNRYDIFDKDNTFENYLSLDKDLKTKYSVLSIEAQNLFKKAINGRQTFISAKKVGEIYAKLENDDKNNFLDFISYFQLYVTKLVGVNTYGLVLDLDYGNPAISEYERSFSSQQEDMIKYGNYFVLNSNKLGIYLYLKHYPGHGSGNIDTHLGILEYTLKDKDYIDNNFWIFESVMKNAKDNYSTIGLMVGHIILPSGYKERFLGNIGEASFVLTDDLGMNAYKKLKETSFETKFFTTNEIIKIPTVINVSTTINQIK